MAKINLSDEEKLKLIEAVNKGVEPTPDLLPKLFPGMAEKVVLEVSPFISYALLYY